MVVLKLLPNKTKTNSVASGPQRNYTAWAAAAGRWIFGVSSDQRGGPPRPLISVF
jgi:hypothetical protein